jgi:DNA phosphorothioation-associated putative methyltransferase
MNVGKSVGTRLYVHTSALTQAAPELVQAAHDAAARLAIPPERYNVVRLDTSFETIALLHYPAFFEDPFPALAQSWKVGLKSNATTHRTYLNSFNPPVLHRKELLLAPNDPRRVKYERLTVDLEVLGFFADPVRIGFKLQWERLLAERSFRVADHALVPLGNDESEAESRPMLCDYVTVARHLTALTRYALSAPVQLLHRYGFLDGSLSVFDYGCGKGDDIRGLQDLGIEASGWDPHYAPDGEITTADVINLGFVINVIEDPVERKEALQRAYALARRVLAVSVMVATEDAVRGRPFADGVLTGRNTFQRYFTQEELREYVEAVLGEPAFSVAPGMAFVFKDKDAEQRFQAGRFRSPLRLRPTAVRPRMREPRAPRVRPSRPSVYEQHRPLLDQLWQRCLELGREPDLNEAPQRQEVDEAIGSLGKALRLIRSRNDPNELEGARRQRTDDLMVYFALQKFQRRQPYHRLEARLQRDVKAFFGSYASAQSAGQQLLFQASQTELLERAGKEASEQGIGWLEPGGYLHLHSSLVSRLPAVLRAYVGCASVLYGDLESVDLVKIHLRSGKVSLMAFDEFDGSPLPRMKRRVKINLRTQAVSVFDYGNAYSPPLLFLKARFLNEESSGYAEQLAFDESLQALRLFDLTGFGPNPDEFSSRLREAHWYVEGFRLERFHYVPELDARCGRYLTYRQLIECGETQRHLALPNLPQQASSYTALYDLAANILDPVIEYFGAIELTYGFCSTELAKHITGGISPTLDQHAAHERKRSGAAICNRLGAAVDFLVRDENMRDVSDWIISNLPFDRLYFYGESSPVHVSFGPENKREVIDMISGPSGNRVPRVRR